jgi:glycosyltransferase involved in cell wall biosynthesis
LLRAFDALRRKVPDAVLLLVGKGDLLPDVQRQADSLALGDSVRFLGTREDVPAIMNASDVFVMSSVWEGLPLVLLEASSVGLPIVATDVGGNAEIVAHGESGLIVAAGDPGALSAALERVLGAPIEERRKMGAHGRFRIEAEYDIERTLDAWEAIYAELARGAGRSTAVSQADKDLSQRRDA